MITVESFLRYLPTSLQASLRGAKSGFFNLLIGVGTVIMKKSLPEIDFSLVEKN